MAFMKIKGIFECECGFKSQVKVKVCKPLLEDLTDLSPKYKESMFGKNGKINGTTIFCNIYNCPSCESSWGWGNTVSFEVDSLKQVDEEFEDEFTMVNETEEEDEVLTRCKEEFHNNYDYKVDFHWDCYCKSFPVCGCGCDPDHNGW